MSPQVAYEQFHAYSKGVAARFLQSVVVVDDKAETSPKTETKQANADAAQPNPDAAQSSKLNEPGRGKGKQAAASKAAEPLNEKKAIDQTEGDHTSQLEDSEVLPIKILNEAFAHHGIVCGFLSPSATGSNRAKIIEAAERSAKRADIVILDWKMEGEEEGTPTGYTALKIIDHILKNDEDNNSFQSSGRLRLIVIYSQTPIVAEIADAIFKHLNNESNPPHDFKREDDYTLSHESTRICVFRKPGGTSLKDGRTYDVNKLTDVIINEFTFLTEGLLSNVAIEALSALRQNTHKILQKFNSTLDAPYLTHRALTNPPEETQSHPIALLASEMQDVLEGHGVINSVSPELIKLWIESLPARITMQSSIDRMTAAQLPEFLIDVVTSGVHKDTTLSVSHQNWQKFISSYRASTSKDSSNKITNLMLSDNSGSAKDKEFSILTTIRSHYNEPPPYLTLGSVIALRNGESSTYFVCVQPVCDCVRIPSARKFPFLKLEHKTGKFDFIVKDGTKYVELRASYKLYDVETIIFSPKDELIKAHKEGDDWIFDGMDTAGNPVEYVWIADLKFAHAQRLAGRFGNEITRVGLTESEWLRRMAS